MSVAAPLSVAQAVSMRRRRGLFWWSLVLTVGVVLIAYAVLIALHAADSTSHGSAGGRSNYNGVMNVLGLATVLTATLLGTTAGAGDLSAGVFRDLVATGRSRTTLFLTCLPGALAVLLPMVALAWGIATAATYAFAGELRTPSGLEVAEYAGYLALLAVATAAIAMGAAQVIGSRGISIGVLLGWFFIVEQLLTAFGTLGVIREALFSVSTDRLRPILDQSDSHQLAMSPWTALAVVASWIAIFLAVGTWRATTREA